MSGRKLLAIATCVLGVLGASRASWAQDKSAEASAVENVPAEPKPLDRGDNAWMLTSSALVLMMTAPGLAMFYGGLVRKKNVLSVMMQCVFLMGLMSVIWAMWGYSLSFGGGKNPWIGNGDYLFHARASNPNGTPKPRPPSFRSTRYSTFPCSRTCSSRACSSSSRRR